MNRPIIAFTKYISFVSKFLKFGVGGTWPGEIALRLNPQILQSFIPQFKKGIIIVSGTNGKTTTSLMIVKILEQQGCSVVHNSSGANLLNGVVSACLQKANWLGKLQADCGVFEVDENSLPTVISQLSSRLIRPQAEHGGIYHNPKSGVKDSSASLRFARNDKALIVVLLNLFRDQLDRYGEVDVIAEKWGKAFKEIRKHLPAGRQGKLENSGSEVTFILNADDPLIAYLGHSVILEGAKATDRILSPKILSRRTSFLLQNDVKVAYFGINDKTQFLKTREHATDSTFCLNCGHRLTYSGIYFSHLGIWKCNNCGAKRPQPQLSKVKIGLPGLYNEYNALAALSVAKSLGLDEKVTHATLQNFQPAFGRQEELTVDGKKIKIFLSKNPAGFNASLRTVLELKPKVLLFVLNDRIPDGRDISWIWDVDFETIPENVQIIVSGDRVYDLALRIKYSEQGEAGSGKGKVVVEPSLKKAIAAGLESTKTGETFYVLPTYSAMLEVRKILGGRKIL